MGDELGSAAAISRLLVSSGLSDTKFHLDRERILVYSFQAKIFAKNWEWVFLDISSRSSRILKLFGAAYGLICQGRWCQFLTPNLQWLARYDYFKNIFVPLFGRLSSCCSFGGLVVYNLVTTLKVDRVSSNPAKGLFFFLCKKLTSRYHSGPKYK